MTLDQYLGTYYATKIIQGADTTALQATVSAALQADPALTAAAQARLSSLTDDVCSRDFVSSVHRDFLRLVLGA